MPRDADGNASLVASYFVEDGDDLEVSQHNPVLEDIAAMLTGSVARNGTGVMLADLNMGTFKATNLANGANPQDAATKSQVDAAAAAAAAATALIAQSAPAGMIVDFAGPAAPTGWLFCYGQAVSRTTYATLFAAIGTFWGAGDGSTTFNLPDFRGRVRAGKDNMGGSDAGRLSTFFGAVARTLAGVLGAASAAITTSHMPPHSHNVSGSTNTTGNHAHSISGGTNTAGSHTHLNAVNGASFLYVPGSSFAYASGGSFSHGAAGMSAAGDHSHTVSGSSDTTGNHSHTVSGGTDTQGGGAAFGISQPTAIVNTIIKAF